MVYHLQMIIAKKETMKMKLEGQVAGNKTSSAKNIKYKILTIEKYIKTIKELKATKKIIEDKMSLIELVEEKEGPYFVQFNIRQQQNFKDCIIDNF